MTLVAGIDPGTNGAIAVYCTDTRRLVTMDDMPTYWQSVNKTKRKRIDAVALMELFDNLNLYGVELLVMEAVGGRPRQSASAGFVFGYTVGLTYMACMSRKIVIETVPPTTWKKMLNIPGKSKAEDDDILNRANELFPHDREMFIDRSASDRGRKRVDRAEAAMLAKFGGDYVLRTLEPNIDDKALLAAHRRVETGA